MEEVSVLIARSREGDKEAREVLIEKNLGLVHHIVRRFSMRGAEMEDLFQIGVIGLMKAIDKFDLSYEVKFSTYAVPMIAGEIKRFLRDDGPIKVSRSVKENGLKVRMATQTLQGRLGRDPNLLEVSREAGLSQEEVIGAMEADHVVESIYACVYQADGSEMYLVDTMAANMQVGGMARGGCIREDTEKEKLMNHMLLEQLMAELLEEERRIIELRYFQNKTQSEVAKILGMNQVQVSRLEKKILLRMRQKVL